MAPPLLNDYKIRFALDRIFKNATGGPSFGNSKDVEFVISNTHVSPNLQQLHEILAFYDISLCLCIQLHSFYFPLFAQ